MSTLTNPNGNLTGLDQGWLLDRDAQYGIITFDGNDMKCLHYRKPPADEPCRFATSFSDAEAQAQNIKRINPSTRVFTYMNMQLGLSRNQIDCPKMYDPAFRGFWLTNKSSGLPLEHHNPFSPSVCESLETPASAYVNLTEHFLDWRNESARQWWLDVKLQAIIDSPLLDGFYWDDPVFGNEMEFVRQNFSPEELEDIDRAMEATRMEGFRRLSIGGKFCVGSTCPTRLQAPLSCRCSRPNSNSNCTCDISASTVKANLLKAAAENSSATIMQVAYPNPRKDVNMSCESPAAVQAVLEDQTLMPQIVQLSCLPGTGNLTVDFASFGLPIVSKSNGSTSWLHPDCAAFAVNPACDAGPAVLIRLKQLCDGQQTCRVNTSDAIFQMLPSGKHAVGCNAPLRLAVRATGCRLGTGGGERAWFRESLAGFLLTRGPHSWMGHGWIAYSQPTWYPEWSLDYGTPTGPIQFSQDLAYREWSKMRVELDVGEPFQARFFPRGGSGARPD